MSALRFLWAFSIFFSGMWLKVSSTLNLPDASKDVLPNFSFKLVNMYECDELQGKEAVFAIRNVSISRFNRTQYVINGVLCATEVLDKGWAGTVKIEHQDSSDSGTRKEIMHFATDDVCDDTIPKFQEKLIEWSKYVENNLSTTCPIQPNCYPVKKLPLQTGESPQVIPGFYYITIRGTLRGEVIWCSTTVFECQQL